MNRLTSGPMFAALLLIAAVSLSAQTINPRASREFGHPKLQVDALTNLNPNYVEGRELNGPRALAFDTSVNPPILYVADTGNNRVLAWRNPANLQSGAMADRVIGQLDFYSTLSRGPGTPLSRGLNAPTGLAVDAGGNLYVADSGNNRILRFRRPLDTQGDLFPDLVIGQVSTSIGASANRGLSDPTDKTLALFRGNFLHQVGMAFDSAGNLWVTDGGNNRVLRYPTSQLAANTIEPRADMVIGQNFFTTDDLPQAPANNQRTSNATVGPTGLAFDDQGSLYVTDQYGRALYFRVGNFNNAQRILGVRPNPAQGQQPLPYPNNYTLGSTDQNGGLVGFPLCVFTLGRVPYFCDTFVNRLVRYSAPENWEAGSETLFSPSQTTVYGQNDFSGKDANRGAVNSSASSFSGPTAGAFLANGGGLWVVDAGNNRVLKFEQDPAFTFPAASVVLGQLGFQYNSPNLVEGRELSLSGFVDGQSVRASSIVVDKSSTPNRLYVADPYNHRILGFKDARKVGVDIRTYLDHSYKADLVIGQQDLGSATINFPGGNPLRPNDTGLYLPTALAVAPNGDLYVADTGNGRVVRFPMPFAQPQGQLQRANLVLGQPSFTSHETDATQSTMGQPTGLAIFKWGGLAVSDRSFNRILIFQANNGDYVNFQPARTVLGQQNFNGVGASNNTNGLRGPRGMDADGNDRLYVADLDNNRVVVYNNTATIGNGTNGTAITQSMSQPHDVALSSTGVLWVANAGNNLANRYSFYEELLINQNTTSSIPAQTPVALTLDAFDNIIVADASHRITFYYTFMFYRNAASFAAAANIQPTFAPNTYVAVGRREGKFAVDDASVSTPYPKTLSGVQVLIDGVAAPIPKIVDGIIYFIVPNDAATAGTLELLVVRPDTGEILAAGSATGGRTAPGFFTAAANGIGPIAAVNGNGTINSPNNPVARGEVLTLYLTGYGHIDGLVDGEAPNRALGVPFQTVVFAGGAEQIKPENILYSGVSPQFPGLWQINIRIPANAEPGNAVPNSQGLAYIVVQYDGSTSNVVGTQSFTQDERVQDSRIQSYYLKP